MSTSERTTIRRLPERGSSDREVADAILDEGFIAHVGIATDDGPVVIPMLYARDADRLLIHGSAASRLLRTAGGGGTDVCVTVTLVDGFVLARSAFHHSVNYRSVVVFGQARKIEDLAEHRAALDVIVETLVPGRTADVRPPSDKETKATIVLELPLDELSVKQRSGEALDEPEDMDLPVWAGVLPLTIRPGAPISNPDLGSDAPPPPTYVSGYRRRGW
jgi:uncharacterized protein